MNRVCSIFSQLLQLFPRSEFEQAVRRHHAEREARGFTCLGQFIAMLFCQLGRAHSLREITQGLAASEGKLKHLGLTAAPNKSTLAYANQHRPWQLYQTVLFQLLARCQALAADRKRPFRFKNKLVSLDATVIDLCLSLYDWAAFRRAKGAIKLHLLLDHDGYLPSFAHLTEGKTHEIVVARRLRLEPGTIVVFDRGYTDYEWFLRLTAERVWFVTRMKHNADYVVVEKRALPPGTAIRSDEVISTFQHARQEKEVFFRRIVVWDESAQRELVFLTNHLGFAASTIAAIYKERWQIELFFKALKQLCKIKSFVGTSANAVKTQVWTALIAMLLLRFLQLKASFGWALSNLLALLRQQLFVYRDLWTWLNQPFQPPPPPPAEQLALIY
ncbi:MAG: IS4 family transposase [Terriglobales bacterium]